jgi:hypothetical protein
MAGTAVAPRGRAEPERGALPVRRMTPRLRSALTGTTTPGKLRSMLALLILGSLAWGALATFTVAQHASAAGTVVAASEPLTVDAEQIWRSLSDADDAATTAILAGGVTPQPVRERYDRDIQQAQRAIEDAAARHGAPGDLATLSTGLGAYESEVATALADNRLGYPLGAAYLRQANEQMRKHLLPAANDLYTRQIAQLTSASGQATGLPLVIVTVLAGLALGLGYYRASRWLLGRTHRVLNAGVLVAGAAGAIALLWLAGAFLAGRADLLTAQSQGSTPVHALVNANIAALKGHADEGLTLINNSGDDSYEADFKSQLSLLGPGTGTLLTTAADAARGSPGAASAASAAADAQMWGKAHIDVRNADNRGDHLKAVGLVQNGAAGAAFEHLAGDLDNAIAADSAAFDSNARSGQDAFTGLEAGMIIATLFMVGGIARGLGRRLAEYR